MSAPNTSELFDNAAPAPTADIAATAALPRAAAREMGDYCDGTYKEAVKTAEAPSMEESNFAELIQARSPG